MAERRNIGLVALAERTAGEITDRADLGFALG
jgi:hypothetical protein